MDWDPEGLIMQCVSHERLWQVFQWGGREENFIGIGLWKNGRRWNYFWVVLLYTEQRNGAIAGSRYGAKGYFFKYSIF